MAAPAAAVGYLPETPARAGPAATAADRSAISAAVAASVETAGPPGCSAMAAPVELVAPGVRPR